MVYLQEIKKNILQEDFPKSPHLLSLEETFFPFWTRPKVSTNISLVQFLFFWSQNTINGGSYLYLGVSDG